MSVPTTRENLLPARLFSTAPLPKPISRQVPVPSPDRARIRSEVSSEGRYVPVSSRAKGREKMARPARLVTLARHSPDDLRETRAVLRGLLRSRDDLPGEA